MQICHPQRWVSGLMSTENEEFLFLVALLCMYRLEVGTLRTHVHLQDVLRLRSDQFYFCRGSKITMVAMSLLWQESCLDLSAHWVPGPAPGRSLVHIISSSPRLCEVGIATIPKGRMSTSLGSPPWAQTHTLTPRPVFLPCSLKWLHFMSLRAEPMSPSAFVSEGTNTY